MDNTSDLFAGLTYQNGLGNSFATEALPGALPAGNSLLIQDRTALLSSNTDYMLSS
jgi:homogentisate 1,2-dioxygenase